MRHIFGSLLCYCGFVKRTQNQYSLFTIFVNLNPNNGNTKNEALADVSFFFSLSNRIWNKNCSLQNESRRKMPHIALEMQSIQMPSKIPKSMCTEFEEKEIHKRRIWRRKKKHKRIVCYFLKVLRSANQHCHNSCEKHQFYECELLSGAVFLSIMQLFDCILAIQHVFGAAQMSTKSTEYASIVQWFWLLLLLLVVGCCCVLFYTIFLGIGVISSSHLLWILELLQLKFNELLDYRICGQSSSNLLCECVSVSHEIVYFFFAMCLDPLDSEYSFVCGILITFEGFLLFFLMVCMCLCTFYYERHHHPSAIWLENTPLDLSDDML